VAEPRDRRWPAFSLRARLTVVATALVAVALLAGTVLLLVALQRSLIAALDESARQRAQDVAALVDSGQLPNPIPVAAGTPLVQVVDAAHRRRLALVVQQVADVVQERRAHERARRALGLRPHRALQRVLQLRDALAFVLALAFRRIQRKNFLHYHGSE